MHQLAIRTVVRARPGWGTRSCGTRPMLTAPVSSKAECNALQEVERVGVGYDGPMELVNRCLDVIAQAFEHLPSTGMYLTDSEVNGFRFWRTMAEEILSLKSTDMKPLYVLTNANAQQPCAVALAYAWSPDQPYDIPQTDKMIRPEVKAEWDACGNLWNELMLDTYDKYGEFITIDFIAVVPELAGRGLGRRLLWAVLRDADATGQAVFLAACGRRNAEWYARHGFQTLHDYCCTVT
ncbi:hypothetical protein Vretimale_13204, partial [Volvox reticuliferus]